MIRWLACSQSLRAVRPYTHSTIPKTSKISGLLASESNIRNIKTLYVTRKSVHRLFDETESRLSRGKIASRSFSE